MKPLVRTLVASSLGWLVLTQAVHAAAPKKEIVIGTSVGDFGDMARFSIKPQLEKRGYKVRLVEFTDYVRPNLALAEGALDVNVFQHKPYLDGFVRERRLPLTAAFQVPTAPLGLYAGRQKALTSAKRGTTVAVPNDPTNMARALVMLRDLGWLKLKPGIDPLRASQHDIAENPKGVRLIQLEAAQLPRSRSDVDFSVINGNYATSSGIRLTEALYQEKSDTYVNWGAIRTADRTQPWVKDLIAAYRSPDFQRWARQKFAGYKFPSDWASQR
ncbi:hypothetical protein J7643_05230 [bacterium]|nr:hypothetical protein [bacterium]